MILDCIIDVRKRVINLRIVFFVAEKDAAKVDKPLVIAAKNNGCN